MVFVFGSAAWLWIWINAYDRLSGLYKRLMTNEVTWGERFQTWKLSIFPEWVKLWKLCVFPIKCCCFFRCWSVPPKHSDVRNTSSAVAKNRRSRSLELGIKLGWVSTSAFIGCSKKTILGMEHFPRSMELFWQRLEIVSSVKGIIYWKRFRKGNKQPRSGMN